MSSFPSVTLSLAHLAPLRETAFRCSPRLCASAGYNLSSLARSFSLAQAAEFAEGSRFIMFSLCATQRGCLASLGAARLRGTDLRSRQFALTSSRRDRQEMPLVEFFPLCNAFLGTLSAFARGRIIFSRPFVALTQAILTQPCRATRRTRSSLIGFTSR